MKKTRIKNGLKLGVFALFIFAFSSMSAQSAGDVAKGSTAVKVIDNKGTIKYFQSSNGITQIVNTTANVTTTTWQLGGTLTDATYINTDGKVFALDGLTYTALSAEAAEGDELGYSLLVRDETTGATRTLLASDLLDSGQEAFTATDGQTTYSLTGSPTLPTFSQVWVYRNGAKLIGTTDYTVSGSAVTLTLAGYPVYAGDVIEIQYIK